jgi:hypothetical protein
MQPTPPEPSSAEPSADVQPIEADSESSQPASSRNFLQRLFHRGNEEPEPQDHQPEPSQPSTAITLTQEQLYRQVQAEADRRDAKRAAAAEADRVRKLRDDDPWAYAEEARRAEQSAVMDAQTTNWLSNVGTTHDRFTVDPVVMSLPEAERNRIMALEGAGIGLEGRQLIVAESLKALEKHWKAEGQKDAEAKLRRNPAFRKQVLNEFRRGMTEPEFIGSGAPSATDTTVSSLLRGQIQARH